MTKRIHFLHIGKTGGTALRHAIQSLESTKDLEFVFHKHVTSIKDIEPGQSVVFFLRDPIKRFVSGFYSRQRKGAPRYNSSWNDQETIAFQRFQHPAQIIASIVSLQSEEERNHGMHALKSIQHVNSHLSYWLGSPEYFETRIDDVLYVGMQDSFERSVIELSAILKLDQAIELPTSPIDAHRNPNYEMPNFTTQENEFLFQWYAQDYELYHRCRKRWHSGELSDR